MPFYLWFLTLITFLNLIHSVWCSWFLGFVNLIPHDVALMLLNPHSETFAISESLTRIPVIPITPSIYWICCLKFLRVKSSDSYISCHSLWFHWCLGIINNDDFDASVSYLWWIYCIWFLTVIPQYEAFDAS